MRKSKYILFVLSMSLIFISVGCQSHPTELSSKAESFMDIEQNIGTMVEDFSKKYGVEPDIQYADNGEGGYPKTGFFQTTINNAMIYGNLEVDHFRNAILDDHRLFIKNIFIELPYDNPADIKLNDSIDTVKQKLDKAAISFDYIDDERIRYSYGRFHYDICFFNDEKLANQIGCAASVESKEDSFKKYCDAVPGGYYIENGDYIVALDQGLLYIYKENAGYSLHKYKAGGSIEQTEDSMIFLAANGTRFKIDPANGNLGLIQDSVEEVKAIAQESTPTQGASKVNTEETELKRTAVEKYEEWDPSTITKVFGKPIAENYDGAGGTLYDGVVLNQSISHDEINSTTTEQNFMITVTSNNYSIYGFYVGMPEKEVSAKATTLGGNGSYGSYEIHQSPGHGGSQTIVINCQGGNAVEVIMQSSIAW